MESFCSRSWVQLKLNSKAQYKQELIIVRRTIHFSSFDHPKLQRDGSWFLDEIHLRKNTGVFVKLENQHIKGRIETKNKITIIKIEPEGVEIPLDTNLLLSWQ